MCLDSLPTFSFYYLRTRPESSLCCLSFVPILQCLIDFISHLGIDAFGWLIYSSAGLSEFFFFFSTCDNQTIPRRSKRPVTRCFYITQSSFNKFVISEFFLYIPSKCTQFHLKRVSCKTPQEQNNCMHSWSLGFNFYEQTHDDNPKLISVVLENDALYFNISRYSW